MNLPDAKICTLAVSLLSRVAYVMQTTPEPWWKVVSGVLAIPASVVGLAYSYILIKKTRLEAKKTELEILEKQSKLQDLAAKVPETARQLISPIVEGRVSQLLLLRFVLLYLILRAWSLVEEVLPLAVKATFAGIITLSKANEESPIILIPFVVLNAIPSLGYYFILFAIGWPLFKDINASIHINLRELFFWWKPKSKPERKPNTQKK